MLKLIAEALRRLADMLDPPSDLSTGPTDPPAPPPRAG